MNDARLVIRNSSLVILFSLLATAAAATPARPQPSPSPAARLDAVAHAAYETLWAFHPVDGTYAGFHRNDGHLCHYTAKSVAALTRKLRGFLQKLDTLAPAALSVDEQIDRELLMSNLAVEIFRLEQLRFWEQNPKLYADECVQGVYYLLLRDFAPLAARAGSVAQRLAEIPQVIAEARQNVRQPPRLYAEAAIEELKSGEEFLAQSAADLGARLPGLKPQLAANAELAIAAMRAYRTELEAGLPSLSDQFAMGRQNYDHLLRVDQFLPFDSDSLLRLGENTFALTDTMINILTRARNLKERDQPRPAEPDALPPRDFSKADVLAYYASEIDSMRAWVARESIATVPDYVGWLQVVETPVFLRGIIPGLAMDPPAPLDSVQTSYFYTSPIPDPLDSASRVRYYDMVRRRGWKGSVVHEGFPGHHLQLSIANHNPSFIRRMQGNTTLIEGWALYCEQMVVDHQLYPDDGFPALRWLGGVKFRAARVILDVQLHTGQITYDSAWKFMVHNFGPDTAFYQGEVRRYCLEPTQAMSYLVGKTQLMGLRRDYSTRMGDKFSLRDFHDRVLAEGSIPLSLIRRKLLP